MNKAVPENLDIENRIKEIGYTVTTKRNDWYEKWDSRRGRNPTQRYHLNISYGVIKIHKDVYRSNDLYGPKSKDFEKIKHKTIHSCKELEKEIERIFSL